MKKDRFNTEVMSQQEVDFRRNNPESAEMLDDMLEIVMMQSQKYIEISSPKVLSSYVAKCSPREQPTFELTLIFEDAEETGLFESASESRRI